MLQKMLILVTILLVAAPALGSFSPQIQIQGILTDANGVPLPDDDYTVLVEFYDAETGGTRYFDQSVDLMQIDGVFTGTLTGFYPDTFHQADLYMQLTVSGESPMTPRTPLFPVPAAMSAMTVDPAYAVTDLNGQKGNVDIVGGANVSVTAMGGQITINANGGASGADNDWTISGDEISHDPGRVLVGGNTANHHGPAASKMIVADTDSGMVVYMGESNSNTDGRHAFYAERDSWWGNAGTGLEMTTSNSAIVGNNRRGGNFTFGVAGYNSLSTSNNIGAVLGKESSGSTWGSIAYRDNENVEWGFYTPNSTYVGGGLHTGTFTMPAGAAEGYILTSDSYGLASWAPPTTVTNDGDWNLSGSSVYRSGSGTVTLGTSSPHNYQNNSAYTTLQIHASSNPTLALDYKYSVVAPLYRWTMTGGTTGLKFNLSDSYSSAGTTAVQMDEDTTVFNNTSGTKRIELITEADLDDGGSISLYGNQSTNSTVHIDGLAGTGGGRILVNDGSGTNVVTITANHDNTGVGRVTTPVLEITGGSDLSEQFDVGDFGKTLKPGMVVSIDPENPGQLSLSNGAYDRRVAGVISGAGGVKTGMVMGQQGSIADGELPVALVGRVYVWADASEGPIEPGDLLTTSDMPGHAMKVIDHDKATGATLGKAMTGLSEGQGLILTLVALH